MSDVFADHQYALGFDFTDLSPTGAAAERPEAAVPAVPRLITWGEEELLVPRVYTDPSGAAVLFGGSRLSMGFARATARTIFCTSECHDPAAGTAILDLGASANATPPLSVHFADPLPFTPIPHHDPFVAPCPYRSGAVRLTLLAGGAVAVTDEDELTHDLEELVDLFDGKEEAIASLEILSSEKRVNHLTGRAFHHLVCEFEDQTTIDVCARPRAGTRNPYPVGAVITATVICTAFLEDPTPKGESFYFAHRELQDFPDHTPGRKPGYAVFQVPGQPQHMRVNSTISTSVGFIPENQKALWQTLIGEENETGWSITEHRDDDGDLSAIQLSHIQDGFGLILDMPDGTWRPVVDSGDQDTWEFAVTEADLYAAYTPMAQELPEFPDPDTPHPNQLGSERPGYGDAWTVSVRLKVLDVVEWGLGHDTALACSALWQGRRLLLMLPGTISWDEPFAIDGAVLIGTIRYCGPHPEGIGAAGAGVGPLPSWAPNPPVPRDPVGALTQVVIEGAEKWRLMELMEGNSYTALSRLVDLAEIFGLRAVLEENPDTGKDEFLLYPAPDGKRITRLKRLIAAIDEAQAELQ